MNQASLVYKPECEHFMGYIPCLPHKKFGVHCNQCEYFAPKKKHLLIIKLGAVGDVIRTTALLNKIWIEHPDSLVWWLTYSPEIVPAKVNKVLPFTLESVIILRETEFDVLINLDKDPQACALAKRIKANNKFGFTLKNGKPAPVNELAEHKFLTGLFDDVSKANTKSYLEEIFEIAGWVFSGEEYILDCERSIPWDIPNEGKKIIGLNTGCGDRWVSRLWKDDYWIELIKQLQQAGYFPMLLGGKQEHKKNSKFAKSTNSYYPGFFSLKEFISLVNQCSLVVSAVTMGMHIAIGLKKPLVLMNNIFNPNEFELYGKGEIVQPSKECKCFFSPKCNNEEYFCMDHLSPDSIFEAIERSL